MIGNMSPLFCSTCFHSFLICDKPVEGRVLLQDVHVDVLLYEAVEQDGQRSEANVVQRQVSGVVQRLRERRTSPALSSPFPQVLFTVCVVSRSRPTYLLRETAEELVQELGEDETDILREGERRGVCVSADFVGTASIATERRLHLVEEVLDKLGDAYVVIMSMDEQHLL